MSQKSARVIWEEVSRESLSDLLSRKRSSREDPRLDHIRCIEGDKSLGNKEKLLRVLALRSIALEFTKKEQDDDVSPTRLHSLYEQTFPREAGNYSRATILKHWHQGFSDEILSGWSEVHGL